MEDQATRLFAWVVFIDRGDLSEIVEEDEVRV